MRLLGAFLAAALTLCVACATPTFTGPDTIRCAHGASVYVSSDVRRFDCEDGLVVTGTLSDNGAGAISAAITAIVAFFTL